MKSRYKMQGESMKSYFGRCLADAEEQLADAKRWKGLFGHIEHNLPMCNACLFINLRKVMIESGKAVLWGCLSYTTKPTKTRGGDDGQSAG